VLEGNVSALCAGLKRNHQRPSRQKNRFRLMCGVEKKEPSNNVSTIRFPPYVRG